MLRILTGYALPGKAWDGWSVHGDRLIAPNGRWYEANTLEQIKQVFGSAALPISPVPMRNGLNKA